MDLVPAKGKMTDEERLALAAKLDQELDDFIEGLERKRYTDGWPEDRWREEMDKHPFFMKKAPEPGDEVHPLFEGMQQLKYDPAENTAEELAFNYKEDGNFYMKHKKYRMAILDFTEGLNTKCQNDELNSILYNNRSAAQFFLKNYRSALEDAQKAVKLNPDYTKARWRAVQCAFHLKRFDLCVELCEEVLERHPDNEEAAEMIKKSKQTKAEIERDTRKKAAAEKKKLADLQRTINVLKLRGVKFDDLEDKQEITKEFLMPKFLPLEDNPIHADAGGSLTYPVALSYPEFLFSDFQQQLSEDVTMDTLIQSVFAEPLECDVNHQYVPGNLAVYYENRINGSVHKINLSKSVKDITQEKNFYVTGGSLLFYVVPTGSRVEQEFLHAQRRPLVYTG